MKSIISNSHKYGVMSEDDKKMFVRLYRKNGQLPKDMRRDLWLLASGAERDKRNNPGYYQTQKVSSQSGVSDLYPNFGKQNSMDSPFGKNSSYKMTKVENNKVEEDKSSMDEIQYTEEEMQGLEKTDSLKFPIMNSYLKMPDPYTEQIDLGKKGCDNL